MSRVTWRGWKPTSLIRQRSLSWVFVTSSKWLILEMNSFMSAFPSSKTSSFGFSIRNCHVFNKINLTLGNEGLWCHKLRSSGTGLLFLQRRWCRSSALRLVERPVWGDYFFFGGGGIRFRIVCEKLVTLPIFLELKICGQWLT